MESAEDAAKQFLNEIRRQVNHFPPNKSLASRARIRNSTITLTNFTHH